MWLLEKFNRPQQAMFSYIHEAMTADKTISPGKAAWESFTEGGGARFADIMDEMGLKGQAGKFDPLDILGVAGEILLDPINLLGVGVIGKFGKARMIPKFLKGVDMAAVEAKAMPKLVSMLGTEEKAASALEMMRKGGVAMPGEFQAKVAQEAMRLVGPEPFSHYLNIGWGKNRVSVPGSQKALEPVIKGGRWVRDRFKGALSTQPKNYTEAMPQALVNVIQKHKAGVNQQFALWSKRLPKEWTKERLATAVEKGIRPGAEAGEAVQEAYELGVWLSDYLPELEEMKGVMTAKYGAKGADIVGGLSQKPSVHLPVAGGFAKLPAVHIRAGDIPTGVKGEQVVSKAFGGLFEEKGVSVYSAWYDKKTGKYVLGGGSGQMLAGQGEVLDRPFYSVVGEILAESGDDAEDLLRPGSIKVTKKISPHDIVYEQDPWLTLAGDELLPEQTPSWKGAKEFVEPTPSTTFADLLDTQGLDPDSDDAINYFIHALHPEARDYIAKHDVRSRGRGKGGAALEPRHASQMMRKIDGTIEGINEWGRETGTFIFTPKGELLKFYRKAGVGIRETIERDAAKFVETGEITEAMNKLGVKLGTDAKTMLADVGHLKKFDQFFIDDWAQGMAMRVGRHTQATAVSEMMEMTMDAKNELGEGRWARPLADAPAGWAPIGDKMPASLKRRLTPEFANKLDNMAFDPEMGTALTKGLNMMYDPKARNEFLGLARKALSWVRASTILPFAGYHVANVVGNRWGRYLMGVADVQYDIIAGQVRGAIKKGDMAGLKKMNFTLGGKKLTGEQLMHHAFFNDVMAGGSMTAEVAGYGRFGSSPMDIGEKMRFRDAINPFGRKQLGAKIATNLEDHDRFAAFIGRLNKGDDFSEAAAAVDKHLFRYSDLTDIEAGTKSMPGIKDATLFYTWYRKNIGLTLQKMWEYPGRLSAPIKVRNALNGIYGDPDSDYAVPSYLKDQFYFYLGKDAEGNPKFLDPEKYLPPLSAAKFFGGGLKGMGREAIGMLIPPIKAGAEAGFGKEAFTGRDLEGVPGQKQAMFGKEIAPAWAYTLKNIRMLNTINRTLFPAAEGPEGRVRAGEAGARPKGALGKAFRREYIGIKLQTTDVQRNRYFEAVSPGGRINSDLDKIASKMAGKTSPLQRESFIQARTELLWEKAEVIRQMIEDGTDPFTGKPMDWQPPMPDPGTRKPHSMRDLYTEMYGTLRGLYFGEPPIPGVLMVEPKARLKPEDLKQTFDTMQRLKMDMLGKDAQYAIQHKNKDILDDRVLQPIRNILKTPAYYERTGRKPSWDTHIYDYPMSFRQALIPLWYQYLESAYKVKLIDQQGVKTRLKTFQELYEVDYR